MEASSPSKLRLSVIGVGYLGAVHAAAMADLGHQVIGIDVDSSRVAALNGGHTPFHEPGFEELLRRNVDSGRLAFTTEYADLVDIDVHFLALGTPQKGDGLGADLSFIDSALSALEPQLRARNGRPTVIAGKSTVPVGTARTLSDRMSEIPGVTLAWNPEFLREGFAVDDTLNPDRLVYGVEDPSTPASAGELLDAVYADILAKGVPRKIYNFESAELVKVSANSFLATKISFINAISELCDVTGADVNDVAEAIGMDDRIGSKFLRAGIGFGGGCLPKDLRGLIARAGELGSVDSFAFLRDIDTINTGRREYVVRLATRLLDGALDGKRIAVLGAAFKPDTDDVRDSPSLDIAVKLYSEGARVKITDPVANDNVRRRYPALHVEDSVESTLRNADLVLLMTEWKQFRDLDPASARALVSSPVVIDGRNVLDLPRWRAAGWHVEALGRP